MKNQPTTQAPRGKPHRANLSNPADYPRRRRTSERPVRPASVENGSDDAVVEKPFPGRDELSPEQRFKGDSSAGSPLSMI